ncbi:MAG: LemA family protein [Bacteroidales bacterium]|jgi:LemA protein|nr:LemA family protein [Bacteroidales bacterium]
MHTVLIIIGVVAVLLLWAVALYNGMIKMRNNVDKEWHNIDVQLERRYALIPNLVETVKGYARHEQETLTKITQYRSQAMEAKTVAQKAEANNLLGSALSGLKIQLEAYPDLKANTNFLQLQEELATTENKISFSRQLYNQVVTSYNNKVQIFPNSIIAGMFHFTQRDLFEMSTPDARQAPKVSF